MRVTIFDYGAGNLHSLQKALAVPGVEVHLETDPTLALETDALVLPGVGAFGAAAAALEPGRYAMAMQLKRGLPCLAICLGMQLLFDESEEGAGAGLGIIPGTVTKLRAARVPQIGWNAVEEWNDRVFVEPPLDVAYYANSFVCRPFYEARDVVAWSTHDGDRFPAAVRVSRTIGVQFHPEKSSEPGVRFVRDFLTMAAETTLDSREPAPRPPRGGNDK